MTATSVASLRITSVTELAVELADGTRVPIHPIWLRERCQDAGSIDLKTGQRLHDPSDLDPQLTFRAVAQTEPGRLRITFSDGHAGEFNVDSILAEIASRLEDPDLPTPTLWDAGLTDLPRARWKGDADPGRTLGWLTPFLRLGFIILEDVPRRPGAVLEVAAAFGFTRQTNFGALFNVRSTPQASDLAYTSLALDPHTDNPYRHPVPAVQLLHCLENETTGGLSVLVDGFAAAAALRREEPDSFRILTRTPVRFLYRDGETELMASAPLIELDVAGEVRAVHFSPRLDFVPFAAPQPLGAYYRARRAFDRRLRGSEFLIRFRLDAGDLVMFDNRRLLHGRTSFDPSQGLRHLQGCYIDIDGPRSLYRVLSRRLQEAAHE